MNLQNYKLPTRRKAVQGEARTYREHLLTTFLEKINECRKQGGFVAFSYPRLAKLLKGYNEVQLQTLLVECTTPQIPFTALFFSKVKKSTQKPRPPEPDGIT